MQNIEDLIRQIVVSPLFKSQVGKQLNQCYQQRQAQLYDSNSVALPTLIEEINGYISQITEIALEEQNSKNFITFMKKTQDLYSELEKKISSQVQIIAEQLKCKIQKMSSKLDDLAKNSNKKAGQSAFKQREQRKLITYNLLQTSRIQNMARQSMMNIKSCLQPRFNNDENYGDDTLDADPNSSMDVEMCKSKSEIAKECNKCVQIWWKKMENSLDSYRKDHNKMQEDLRKSIKELEDKIDGNLQSIWNVISDLCSRISKMECMEEIQI